MLRAHLVGRVEQTLRKVGVGRSHGAKPSRAPPWSTYWSAPLQGLATKLLNLREQLPGINVSSLVTLHPFIVLDFDVASLNARMAEMRWACVRSATWTRRDPLALGNWQVLSDRTR